VTRHDARRTTPRPPTSLLAVMAIVVGVASWFGGSHAATLLRQPRLTLWGYSVGARFSQPQGVAIDPVDGAVYVSNTGQHRIEVFSASGRPLTQFVHRVTGDDGIVVDGSPRSLAFDRSGRLLVVDAAARYVDVLDVRARGVARLRVPEGHPTAVAVAKDGGIFVGTGGAASKVFRFRADYTADGGWGDPGTAPGALREVVALGVLDDSTIAVACPRTDLAIQVFTRDGRFVRGFGTHDVGDGNFSMPCGMVVTPDGRLWVLDEIRQVLQVFGGQGDFLTKSNGTGTALGEFVHPSSLAFDERGLLAVADREAGRVQVFAVTTPLVDVTHVQP